MNDFTKEEIEELVKIYMKACDYIMNNHLKDTGIKMMKEDKNVTDAKNSIKSHIKFMETLLQHLNSSDLKEKGRAMFAAWCIHRFFNERLADEIRATITDAIKDDLNV